MPTKQEVLNKYGIGETISEYKPNLFSKVRDIYGSLISGMSPIDKADYVSGQIEKANDELAYNAIPQANQKVAQFATTPIPVPDWLDRNPRIIENTQRLFQGKKPINDVGNSVVVTPLDLAIVGTLGTAGVRQRVLANKGLQEQLGQPLAEAEALRKARMASEAIDVTPNVEQPPRTALPSMPTIRTAPQAVMAGGKTSYVPTPQEVNKLSEITPSSMNIVSLNKDTVVKDLFGNVKTYKKGEDIHIYQDKNTGKALVKDGDWGLLPNKSVQMVQQSGNMIGEKVNPEEAGVEEVVKDTKLQKQYDALMSKSHEAYNRGFYDLANQYQKQAEAIDKKGNLATKFSQYQLPGGENYREVLFKAPSQISTKLPDGYSMRFNDKTNQYEIFGKYGGTIPKAVGETKESALRMLSSGDLQYDKDAGTFKSGHWDEPNVISHARVNDRITPDGKKILFVEEIQSDWNKMGREKGFSGQLDLTDVKMTELPDVYNGKKSWRVIVGGKKIPGHIVGNNRQEVIENLKKYNLEGAVPYHPLLKNWQEFTLKRILKKAIAEGYDGIAWTTGEQQAERYDLSKQINSVHYIKQKDGQVAIKAYPINDNGLNTIKKTVPENEVSQVVGKDLAEKIKNGPGEGMFSGMDLKIGGEWAKNLYDKQIPNILKDLTKGEVGNIELVKSGEKPTQYKNFDDWQKNKGGKITQPYLPITPQIKAKMLGQPKGGGMTTGIGEPPKTPPKPTAVAPEEPDPINNLNISGAAKEKLKEVADSIAKELGDIRGTEPLTHAEVIEAAKTADVLNRTMSRESTLKLEAQILKAKQHLGALAEGKGVSKELIDTLKILSTEATNAGRVLESHKIEALPEYATIKIKLIKELIRMGKDADEIVRISEGVDFTNQREVTRFYRQFVKPKLKELISEYRYINLLSSPKTHIVNTFSNILQTIGLDPATKLLSGEASKIPDYYAGVIDAIPEAYRLAANALKGNIYIERPDLAHIPSGNPLLRPFQIIPRALEASDVFFRTLVKNGEIATGKTEAEAMKKAQYYVFRAELDPTNKTGQGHVLSAIDSLTSGVYKLRSLPYVGPVVSWFIPFLQTPMNIFKQGVEYSPAGFSTLPGAENKREQLGKALLGSLIALGAGYLAFKNRTTWAVPRGKKEKELFYSAGMQPYSLKIGDKWVSYSRIGPLAFPIAMAAAVKYYSQDSKTALTDSTIQKIGKMLGGTAGFFADQSYLQGVNDLVSFMSGDVNASAKTIANAASQLVPLSSLLRWVNNMVDPIYRKTDKGFSLGAISQNIIKGIPGLSQRLEPYRNVSGKPSERQMPVLNSFIPTTASKENRKSSRMLNFYNKTKQNEELLKSGKPANRIFNKTGITKEEVLKKYGI